MSDDDAVWITGVGRLDPARPRLRGDRREPARRAGRASGPSTSSRSPTSPAGSPAGSTGIPCPAAGTRPSSRPAGRSNSWSSRAAPAALRDSGWWDRRARGPGRPGARPGRRVADHLGGGRPGRGRLARSPGGPRRYVELARRELGLTGPALGLSAACASGNHALAVARHWLRLGWADVCLAGGCDMAVTPMSMACFGNLRALSRRNDDPTAGLAPVRPRPRRLRDRRRGRGLRPGAGRVGPRPRGPGLRRGRRLRRQQRRPPRR